MDTQVIESLMKNTRSNRKTTTKLSVQHEFSDMTQVPWSDVKAGFMEQNGTYGLYSGGVSLEVKQEAINEIGYL
jgi:hypothetical protein